MEVTKIDVQQLILTIHELVKENFSNKIELNDLVFTVLDHAPLGGGMQSWLPRGSSCGEKERALARCRPDRCGQGHNHSQ